MLCEPAMLATPWKCASCPTHVHPAATSVCDIRWVTSISKVSRAVPAGKQRWCSCICFWTAQTMPRRWSRCASRAMLARRSIIYCIAFCSADIMKPCRCISAQLHCTHTNGQALLSLTALRCQSASNVWTSTLLQAMSAADDDATLTQLAIAWTGLALGGAKAQEAAYAFQELGDKYTWTVRSRSPDPCPIQL